jgi:hypothetical protein
VRPAAGLPAPVASSRAARVHGDGPAGHGEGAAWSRRKRSTAATIAAASCGVAGVTIRTFPGTRGSLDQAAPRKWLL